MAESRRKGACGERELASRITELFGVPARRGQQFRGGSDSPDVVHGLAGLHLECKRTEKLRLWEALDQAASDAGARVPAVCHRPNRRDWVVIVKLADLPRMARLIEENRRAVRSTIAPDMRTEKPSEAAR